MLRLLDEKLTYLNDVFSDNKPPEFIYTTPNNITVQNHQPFTLNLQDFVVDEDKGELQFNVTTQIPTDEFDLTGSVYFKLHMVYNTSLQ